jgi:outer membrane protein assembly factor BamB
MLAEPNSEQAHQLPHQPPGFPTFHFNLIQVNSRKVDMFRFLFPVLIGASVFGLSMPSVRAENWPQWRGMRADGVSTEKQIAQRWSPKRSIRWKSPLPGQGGATPAVWFEKIFLTSSEGDDLVAMCLNSASGQVNWKTKVTSGNIDARAGEGNSASPSPVTDGVHVWVFFSNGVLACLDCFDGSEKWRLDVGERFGKLDIQFGMTSTPVLGKDGLYLQLIHGPMKKGDSNRTGKVIKLDKDSGKTIWAVDRRTEADFECKHSYASPCMYDDGKQKFFVVHGADCTTGHALEDGREIWRLDQLNGPTKINEKNNDPTFRFVASPLAVPGTILVPTAKEGPLVAIDAKNILKGKLADKPGAIRWVCPKTPDVSIPLIVEDCVYLLHKDGKLQCLDLATGREHYNERTHTSQHRASPVYADGHLYICARDGVTSIVRAGHRFELIAQNDLAESTTASPVIANGVLYLRTYNALYAIK